MPDRTPQRYDPRQRRAHWLVAALVAAQYLSGGAMAEAYRAAREANAPPSGTGAALHAAGGLAILGVMLWRLSLRRRLGAPPPPSELSPGLQRLSRANHAAFYLVLIGMPLVGAAAAATLTDGLALLHAYSAALLGLLVAAHVTGAMWHAATPGSPVIRRMLGPRTDGAKSD